MRIFFFFIFQLHGIFMCINRFESVSGWILACWSDPVETNWLGGQNNFWAIFIDIFEVRRSKIFQHFDFFSSSGRIRITSLRESDLVDIDPDPKLWHCQVCWSRILTRFFPWGLDPVEIDPDPKFWHYQVSGGEGCRVVRYHAVHEENGDLSVQDIAGNKKSLKNFF